MTAAALVEKVEAGSTVIDECPLCLLDRESTPIQGLTARGVVPVATIVSCGCGDHAVCAMCPTLLALDGASIYDHIATAHNADPA